MSNSAQIARLKRNPFTLVADTNTDVWADYESVRQSLLDVIMSCRMDQVGLSEFVVLHGEIGTGKSHALRYLQNYISVQHAAEFQSPCVYLESTKLAKKTDFLAIYRRTMEGLRDHIIETANAMDKTFEERAKASGLTRPQDLRTEKDRLWKTSAAILAPHFPSLILMLKEIATDDNEFSVLCGAKSPRLAQYQLTGPIDSEYDATRALSAYINLVTSPDREVLSPEYFKGNKAVYLFLDEVELLQDFKPGDVLSINQGIRDLINGCPQAFCLIFGVSGDPRILFALFDKFVVRRFSREPIEIQALDEKESVRFLKEVLKNYRADPSDPDEYPFREAALTRIAEKTLEKTAASLFRSSRRVLERAVLTGKLTPGGWIEADDVDELLM